MQRAINGFLCVLVIISSASCRQHMKPAAYAGYVTNKENGLKKTSEVDGWQFVVQYRPYDYIVLMENKGQTSGYTIDKRKAELAGTACFNISIKRVDNSISPLKYGINTIEEYNNRLNYYLNEAQKDIKLVYDKDTLYPVSYLFENNYNLSPQETMVVSFNLPGGEKFPSKKMRLSFVDRIFRNGIINAEYSERTLNNLPALVY